MLGGTDAPLRLDRQVRGGSVRARRAAVLQVAPSSRSPMACVDSSCTVLTPVDRPWRVSTLLVRCGVRLDDGGGGTVFRFCSLLGLSFFGVGLFRLFC